MAFGFGTWAMLSRVRTLPSVVVFLLITSNTGVWGWSTPIYIITIINEDELIKKLHQIEDIEEEL